MSTTEHPEKPTETPKVVTLADLPKGASARVLRILGTDVLTVRILEMGLIPGITVTMQGRAPLGDPLDIVVRGYRLSLRASEAKLIEIVPL